MHYTNKKCESGSSVSQLGYKDISPYKDSPYLDILSPSGEITMKGVSKPLLGISDTGESKIMIPGQEYKFNSKLIREIPMKRMYQMGGQPNAQPAQQEQPSPADIISAYIDMHQLGQKEAEEIYKSFYKMSPEDKQIFLQNIMQEVQESHSESPTNPEEQQEMAQGQEPQMMVDGQQAMMVGGIPVIIPNYFPGHKKMQAGYFETRPEFEYGNEGVQNTYNTPTPKVQKAPTVSQVKKAIKETEKVQKIFAKKQEEAITQSSKKLADLLNADVQQNKGYTKYLDDTINIPTPSVPTPYSNELDVSFYTVQKSVEVKQKKPFLSNVLQKVYPFADGRALLTHKDGTFVVRDPNGKYRVPTTQEIETYQYSK